MLRFVQENPYAPSMVDQARVAPASRGWQIVDGRLLVEQEAILPMVDLYTGETSERMTAIRLGLQRRVIWPRLLMLASMLMMFASPALGMGDGWSVAGMLLFLAALFAWVAVPSALGYVTLFVFVGQRNHSRNLMVRWATIVLLVLMVGMVGAGANVRWVDATDAAILNFFPFVWIALAVALIFIRRMRRRLYWRPAPGEKREMIGVHPKALELLQREPPPAPSRSTGDL
jgi:hypothetical protein